MDPGFFSSSSSFVLNLYGTHAEMEIRFIVSGSGILSIWLSPLTVTRPDQ